MEYQVPQFIEVEDKIVGPLTFQQFLYLGGSAGGTVVCFLYLPFVFAVLLSIGIIALGASLAFYKINGKPFIQMLEAGFNYLTGAKFFLWRHKGRMGQETTTAPAPVVRATPKLTRGKLSELAQSLDTRH